MHEAYEFHQLIKLSLQIESLSFFDDKLLVGTKVGHLLMYKFETKSNQKPDIQLICYKKLFSKKPILQIEAIPEHDVVLSLSENVISIYELHTFNFALLKSVSKTKGATLFCLNKTTEFSLTGIKSVAVKMCVAIKRKLQFYYLKNRDLIEFDSEISLSDEPRAMIWSGKNICVGFRSTYCIINLESRDQKELFPPGKSIEPIVTYISDHRVALGKDTVTHVVDLLGKVESNQKIKWSELPLAIFYDEPYFVCLLRDRIEVGVPTDARDPSCVQLLPISGAHVGIVSSQGSIFVASNADLWLISLVDVQRQIKVLLEEKRFDLAHKLAAIADDPPEEKQKNVYQIQTLYAFDLFHNQKYDKSMEEFLKLKTDPYQVIRLFPQLLPQESADGGGPEECSKMDDGIPALIRYLVEARMKLMAKPAAEFESRQVQQLMKIIDTTLVKCYLKTNDALVAPVLRRNYCHFEETEKTLKIYQKYSELIILYQANGMHRKALELLKQQADYSDSPLSGTKTTVTYLQNLGSDHLDLLLEFAKWVLEADPRDGLRIFIEDLEEVRQFSRLKILDFLLKTQPLELTIQYLEHVIHVWQDKYPSLHNGLAYAYREQISRLGGEAEAPTLKKKLLAFLETSTSYQADVVLLYLPADGFLEERATVNRRLGRHSEALAIYVCLLDDYHRALDYCSKAYAEGAEDVYLQLLRVLLAPPDALPGVAATPAKRAPDQVRAIGLLAGHAAKLEPAATLKELPDSTPLAALEGFLKAALHRSAGRRRHAQLLRSLLITQSLSLERRRLNLEKSHFTVADFRVCPLCDKRFSGASAFVRLPNNDVVHYSCHERSIEAA